jgi:hypothetical protein
MKFAYLPKGDYRIGQPITVQGKNLQVESYSHTGKNLVATTIDGAAKFERFTIILTDEPAIGELK